jgi:hypothetical protein
MNKSMIIITELFNIDTFFLVSLSFSLNYSIRLFSVCLLMVFNATFNNISVTNSISLRSVLLVEETRGPRENHRPVASHRQTLSQNAVHLSLIEIRTHNISGDCIGSCKSNYHTITAMTAPLFSVYNV